MHHANKISLASAIFGGDATLTRPAKERGAAQLVAAPAGAIRVLASSPAGERGVEVFFHIAGDYRRKSVICEGKKWRSQWRRLGAVFPAQ
jgi:hypothetical protein